MSGAGQPANVATADTAVATGATGTEAMVTVNDPVVASAATPLLAVTVKVDDPAPVGAPESTPALDSERPAGNDPDDTMNVGAGTPEAANVYEYAAPIVPVAGGVFAVNTGATGSGAMVTVNDPVVASGATPLLAVTLNVNNPAPVGVPESTPALDSERPAGNDPDDTANVGAGSPEAVNVYEYPVPIVPEAGGVLEVNAGATGTAITDTVLSPRFAT